ncbi:acyltransferase family protein [Peristeroidobacter agariperforans]|uniref:acyltransferase family protein n=1 Tax=Peristeroidobacter agariperforans TaxID=268404 RepID=UPI0013002361|nr:acyltransferase [Peristeroidobacter agariperforans]
MSSTAVDLAASKVAEQGVGDVRVFAFDHLPGLDALRFAAVYLIVLSHLGYKHVAGFGVPILMALSGFLVTILLLREHERTNTIDVRKFYRRRFFRIAPQYLAFLILAFSADWFFGNPWPDGLIYFAATYTVNYYNAIHGHPDLLIAHVWTLAVLEQFYLIWPPICAWLVLRKHPERYLLAIIGVVILWRSFAYYVVFDRTPSWVYNALDCRLDSILVGALAAFAVFRLQLRLELLRKLPWAAILVATAAIALIKVSNDWKPWHYSVGYTVEALLAMVAIFAIIVAARFGPLRVLENKVIGWLAGISYGVFLYHSLAIGAAKKVASGPATLWAVSTVIVLMLAAASSRFIERPASRWR